ncbi:hypothetical protein D3C73_962240 [compost metagenome]
MVSLNPGIHYSDNNILIAFGQIPALLRFNRRQIPLVRGEQQIIWRDGPSPGIPCIFACGIVG